MTMRILVVARGYPSYDAPGRGSFVADHVLAMRAAGVESVVASFETVQLRGPEDGRPARALAAEAAWGRAVAGPDTLTEARRFGAAGVPVARLPVVRTWGPTDGSEVPEMAARHAVPLLAFGRALAARSAADGRPIDLIHAHNGLPDGLAAMALAAALGLPLVVTEHDSTLPRRLRRPEAATAYRELLRTARVVAVSEALSDRIAGALATYGGTAPPASLDVLPNPIPLDRFPAPGDDPRDADELLWVGARSDHKGIETLLRAVRLVRERRPSVHLRAIGPASAVDDARWVTLAEELGIAAAVTFAPAVERDGVAAAMRHAGIFVHPSPFETFGVVAAEALASGLPVAATPSGGVEAIVGSDGASGEIAADSGPAALAEAILRLHDRLPAIDRGSLRAGIEARFAPDLVAARTLELYADARRTSPVTTSTLPAGPPSDGESTIGTALVIAGHPSARGRVTTLPAGGLPVQIVGPPRAERPSAVRRWLRRLTGRPTIDRRSAHLQAVRSAWHALTTGNSAGRVVIVPADAEDLQAAIDALGDAASTHLAPGSLRWLADRQDASAEPVRR